MRLCRLVKQRYDQHEARNARRIPMQDHSPMRLAKREICDAGAIKQIISECATVRIGAVDDEGVFIVPMSFGFDFFEDASGKPRLTLWVHGAGQGRKARCFAASPRVAVEMDREDGVICGSYSCAYSYAYRSIMGSGIISQVEDRKDKEAALARIMEHMAPQEEASFAPEAVERCCIWRIDVDHLTAKQRAAKKTES